MLENTLKKIEKMADAYVEREIADYTNTIALLQGSLGLDDFKPDLKDEFYKELTNEEIEELETYLKQKYEDEKIEDSFYRYVTFIIKQNSYQSIDKQIVDRLKKLADKKLKENKANYEIASDLYHDIKDETEFCFYSDSNKDIIREYIKEIF